MRSVQDFVKKGHEKRFSYRRLVFLTSTDGCCNDTSDRSVPNDSILTDDLQLNWSAFTPNQTENFKKKIHQKVRKLIISYEPNGVKLLCDNFHTL